VAAAPTRGSAPDGSRARPPLQEGKAATKGQGGPGARRPAPAGRKAPTAGAFDLTEVSPSRSEVAKKMRENDARDRAERAEARAAAAAPASASSAAVAQALQGQALERALELVLHNAKLDAVPKELSQCKNLRVLDLSFNCITSPTPLVHLSQLRELRIYDNRLGTLKTLPKVSGRTGGASPAQGLPNARTRRQTRHRPRPVPPPPRSSRHCSSSRPRTTGSRRCGGSPSCATCGTSTSAGTRSGPSRASPTSTSARCWSPRGAA